MYVNLVDYRWCNCISCNTLTCNYIYPAFIIVSREKFHGEGMDEIISLRRTRIVFYCVPFSSNRVCCAHIYLILEKPRALSRPIKYLFPSQFHFPRFIRIWQMIVTFADILSRKKNIDFAIPRPLRISLAIFLPREISTDLFRNLSRPIWISGKIRKIVTNRILFHIPFSLDSQINNKYVAIPFCKNWYKPGFIRTYVRTMEEMFSRIVVYIHERCIV